VIPRNASSRRRRTAPTFVCSRRSTSAAAVRSICIADVFNVFNRPNWTVGENEATAAQFLQHTNGTFVRMQVGFRLTY
jgi:hypothetical protein